jgi:hypothetical protein
VQACLAVTFAAVLAVGMVLTPSPTGTGTHTILGLPPCGMLVVTGHPCPTCGVTTSYVLAAHGRFRESLVNQPFGLASFAVVAFGLGALVVTLATGRSWSPVGRGSIVVTAVIVMTALAVASWIYKWATM